MFTRARFLLAAAFAAVLVLAIAALAVIVLYLVRRELDSEIDRSIADASDHLALEPGLLALVAPGAGLPSSTPGEDGGDADDAALAAVLSTDLFVVVTSGDEEAVPSSPRLADLGRVDFAKLADRADEGDAWDDVRGEHNRYRIESRPVVGSEDSYLHVGRSLATRDHQLRSLVAIFAAGGLCAALFGVVGGFWLAGRALLPIRQALDAQRRFVSDASHELRTPLAAIRANNELLLRHPESTIEESLARVEAVAEESAHMTRMIDDLLTLARADEGKLEIASERVDVGSLAADVCRDVAALAELHGVAVSCTGEPVNVVGDRTRLRQLLLILVDNALKHTPSGGAVKVSVVHARRRVELHVADTGSGVPTAEAGRIFDRFVRLDESRSTDGGGAGLGLAIARTIVEAHRGRISVASAPGQGSTFVVSLPAGERSDLQTTDPSGTKRE